MTTSARPKLKSSMMDKLRRAFSAKDEAGFEEAMSVVEEAAQATEEDQAKAEFAQMIGAAVSEAIAPITARLDDVDAFIADRKTKDAEAEEARKKAEADTKDRKAKDSLESGTGGPADGATAPMSSSSPGSDPAVTGDNDGLAAFLSSKGLSEGDVAACLAMIKKDDAVATSDEDGLSAEEKEAKETEAKKSGTTDSASLVAEFRDTVAKAEILFPGVKLPVFDAKAKPTATADAICALRRRALRSAFDSKERKANVAPFVDAAPDFSKMTCDAVKMAFGGASELAKRANAPSVTFTDGARAHAAGVRDTIAAMNTKAKDLWQTQR